MQTDHFKPIAEYFPHCLQFETAPVNGVINITVNFFVGSTLKKKKKLPGCLKILS